MKYNIYCLINWIVVAMHVKWSYFMLFAGLSRDLSDAQDEFAKHDGFSVLMRAMQTNVEKLKVKAAFMISSMCFDRPQFKGGFNGFLNIGCI